MKCVFCGGSVRQTTVTFEHEESGRYLLVENVPAEVCSACGEKTYSPEVTDRLLRFARWEFAPIKTIRVPVFNYGSMS